MINKEFEVYKLKRELRRSGVDYEFKRPVLNEFKEPDDENSTVVGTLRALYHEQNSNIAITTGDTTRTRTKKIPMLLCVYEEVEKLGLQVDDFVMINNKKMKVTGVVNIQEWNLIGDISLEVVDIGV